MNFFALPEDMAAWLTACASQLYWMAEWNISKKTFTTYTARDIVVINPTSTYKRQMFVGSTKLSAGPVFVQNKSGNAVIDFIASQCLQLEPPVLEGNIVLSASLTSSSPRHYADKPGFLEWKRTALRDLTRGCQLRRGLVRQVIDQDLKPTSLQVSNSLAANPDRYVLKQFANGPVEFRIVQPSS